MVPRLRRRGCTLTLRLRVLSIRPVDWLAFLDATAQADLVRRGEVTPLELVEAAITRIERLNPRLNAVVTPMHDLARRAAQAPPTGGAFPGVPFLLKDLGAEYAGVGFTEGSAFLAGQYIPAEDSTLVVRLKRAGLIVLGKTNTPEFGILPTTEPRLFGPARNPWDTGRSTGGSSGGSAAAVAAGLVPMAHANDGGGSIRIPASCCGLFGLKPTRARNPLGPHYGDLFSGLVVEHAVTRSVRDSAALLDATAGPEAGDPYWAPPPARPFLDEVGADPGRLRIAFTTHAASGVPIHADCVLAVQETARLCESLGHELIEAAPVVDGEEFSRAFITLWSSGCAWTIDDWARRTGRLPRPEEFEPLTWMLSESGRANSAAAYLLALQDLQRVTREVARFFERHHCWLTPTVAEPPLPLGSFDPTPEDPLNGLRRSAAFVPFTPIANVTGQPAMSVPLSWNAGGLPVGVHFVGRFGDEATLFRLAAQLEAARPWAHRCPPTGVA
ncbi:MAG: amidase [Candidatus Rokubacteria bacterium]|nr:amidase [Candidatus Rokubacteria bacterium]MBI3105468.1 amidase [Candidatus Rokubacteria bacterium]